MILIKTDTRQKMDSFATIRNEDNDDNNEKLQMKGGMISNQNIDADWDKHYTRGKCTIEH